MNDIVKLGDPMTNAFEALGRKFRVIDMKYNNGEGETKRNDLVVVSNDVQPDEPVTETQDEPVVETQSETDQGEELSGKIADLNDQFRSCTSLSSNEFNGEWIYGDDIKALPPTTKAAIKKKIREYPLDQFTDCPLHDRGRFVHETKKDSFTVIWMIKVYQDDMMLAEAEHPDDPAQSYRTLAVALSDQPDEG